MDEEGDVFPKTNAAFKFYVRNKIIKGAVRSLVFNEKLPRLPNSLLYIILKNIICKMEKLHKTSNLTLLIQLFDLLKEVKITCFYHTLIKIEILPLKL